MDVHPNVDLLRRLYAAMRSGDVATLQQLHTADFRLSISGTSAISGEFEGVRGAAEQFEQSMALTGGQLEMTVRHRMAIGQARGRADRDHGQDATAEALLGRDPFALSTGMLLDQPMRRGRSRAVAPPGARVTG
ncbi:hypothetical protein [Blastococcus capsensis]|uniref:hypothetical protein n=1 Tax=Blastococcus capsensis TaxID=1564163 RepID=UPI002541285C|nr:hypothetical protein [Blastococcus capsensis]MDK3256463.1 hypothetical protein [Blastococcus capsensis]